MTPCFNAPQSLSGFYVGVELVLDINSGWTQRYLDCYSPQFDQCSGCFAMFIDDDGTYLPLFHGSVQSLFEDFQAVVDRDLDRDVSISSSKFNVREEIDDELKLLEIHAMLVSQVPSYLQNSDELWGLVVEGPNGIDFASDILDVDGTWRYTGTFIDAWPKEQFHGLSDTILHLRDRHCHTNDIILYKVV
jgi:hypothetical protein